MMVLIRKTPPHAWLSLFKPMLSYFLHNPPISLQSSTFKRIGETGAIYPEPIEMTMSLPTEPLSWHKGRFLISTDKKLLSIPAINSAFDQDFLYWAQSMPDEVLQKVVDNSFCFGLFEIDNKDDASMPEYNASLTPPTIWKQNLKQIGFARLITDDVTFVYFTDLYVLPEYQGLGLGGWIIECIDEVLQELPYLRWIMLRTSSEKSQQSYETKLGMHVLKYGDASEGPVMMGRKGKANMA